MQTTIKKVTEKPKTKSTPRVESTTVRKTSKEEDILKKKSNVTTPRNYLQKTSTSEIYKQNKNVVNSARAPKKVLGTTHKSNNPTPSKDYLKSSASSISQISAKSVYDKTPRIGAQKKLDDKEAKAPLNSARKTPRTAKNLPFVNVTVNSPPARRKLVLNTEVAIKKEKGILDVKKTDSKEVAKKRLDRGDSVEIAERQRTKTRTLSEEEVKVLSPAAVDNNAEMYNLSKKLSAKPKAFYVEIEKGNTKITEKQSDEEVSYEDDFESYESDFDSYHSSGQSATSSGKTDEEGNDSEAQSQDEAENHNESVLGFGDLVKNSKDEEKMLDSGNFELRDRSASKYKHKTMEFIMEDSEDDRKPSLTDEGFQDMSNSSAVSSMRTHVDVLDRPFFIDFSKSKENKRKKKINERLRERAKDLLAMITLHEMSYTLFEMKPIPYDLYMATFGRSNYTQIAVQTFDDGITEEVQTEEILYEHKWTQHPIEFSKHDVHIYPQDNQRMYGKSNEDYLTKFTFLMNKNNVKVNNQINLDKSYKENPLRVYFEQKDGVGSSEMLPYESYKKKMEKNDFNSTKLMKFLKKMERRISNILSLNCGDKNIQNLKKSSKLSFSKGYSCIQPKLIDDEKFSAVKRTQISSLIFSETRNNLIMSVHKKSASNIAEKCIICLWDISVARKEPVKILVAVDNVTIGRFKGNTDGIFVGALEDGSLHLWGLSEEPTWRDDVDSEEKPTNLVEVRSEKLTQTEIDREWNLKNSNVRKEQLPLSCALQACAYTNSAINMAAGDVTDRIVGLEFVGEAHVKVDGGRRVIGQVCTLQRIGILSLWSLIQEKRTTMNDIGRAYWSRMRLEKAQTINLLHHIDIPAQSTELENIVEFNLNAAKRRLSGRKIQKIATKKDIVRPKSTSSSEFDISRPASAASSKKILPVEKKYHENWESGILCCDLKITRVGRKDTYLVAKNNGEVLCCTKFGGAVKVDRFSVTVDTSTVTCLAVSPHGLPYFLAATDTGTVNLCSLFDARVLLTLDCRNIPSSEIDVCRSDHKGRFISSTKVKLPISSTGMKFDSKLVITSLHWSPSNPCSIHTVLQDGSLVTWDLTHSDICARSFTPHIAAASAATDGAVALLTPEGEIQVHRVGSEQRSTPHLDLFKKYVTLL